MYNVVMDVSAKEYAVWSAIKELHGNRLNKAIIASHIGCSEVTVARAMARLSQAGKIRKTGSRRTGYFYQTVGEWRGKP